MSLLHILSYGAILATFAFVTLSFASGLLYVSELIEEHSRLAKTVGQRGIYTIIILHVMLYFTESLPLLHTIFSASCHVVYLQNFSNSWPLISLSSVSFIASCLLVVADHFLWFFYFSRMAQEARRTAHSAHGAYNHGFTEIATFFGICVWLAPLFLFLSLSANDRALPVSGGLGPSARTSTNSSVVQKRGSLFKAAVDLLPDSLTRLRPKASRKSSEGIIAPPSPLHRPPSSPITETIYALNNPPASPRTPGGTWPTSQRVSAESPTFKLGEPPRGALMQPHRNQRKENGGLGMRRAPSSSTNNTANE